VKIAVVTSTYPRYQGDSVGSFVHSLSYSLTQLGHDVTVLAPYDPAVVPGWQSDVNVKRIRYVWPERWSLLGHARSLAGDVRLRWHAYPLTTLFSTAAVLRLWAEVARQESDVIYAQWLVPSGFIGAIVSRLTRVPLVVSLHGSDVFVAERYKSFRPAVRFVFRTARHIIACSTNLASRTTSLGASRDAITIVPYGVDTEQYVPNPQSAQELRARLTIPESQNIVMVMGRLVHKKGFAHFLRAVPLVLARCPNTLFLVAGDGYLRTELETLAESLRVRDRALFAGQVPWSQTPAYLAMTDVFVVPSVLDDAGNLDGLPNVLLESLASGCAVVASRVAGIPEVVQDGQNGLLVPQKDERALADAICALLTNPELRQRLGRAAQASVVGRLSWAHVGAQIAGVLQTSIQTTS
jgi:glycosyltransferase involved in cell wall biosynthesis